MKLGDWVLIYFPAEDSGKQRKLSLPWHDPYLIVAKDKTNITAKRVYFPDEKSIKIHQSQVQMCPFNFSAGMVRNKLVKSTLQNGWNNCYRLVEQGMNTMRMLP